jgi:hypothetical protein
MHDDVSGVASAFDASRALAPLIDSIRCLRTGYEKMWIMTTG